MRGRWWLWLLLLSSCSSSTGNHYWKWSSLSFAIRKYWWIILRIIKLNSLRKSHKNLAKSHLSMEYLIESGGRSIDWLTRWKCIPCKHIQKHTWKRGRSSFLINHTEQKIQSSRILSRNWKSHEDQELGQQGNDYDSIGKENSRKGI